MKILFKILAIIIIITSIILNYSNAIEIDRSLANVNNYTITKSEFKKNLYAFFLLSKIKENKKIKNNRYFIKELIGNIAINKAQLKTVKKYNLKIEEKKFQSIIDNVKKNKTKNSIREKILYKNIKNMFITNKLQEYRILQNTQILANDIDEFLQNHKEKNSYNLIYLILNSSNKTKEEIKNFINTLKNVDSYKKLKKNKQIKIIKIKNKTIENINNKFIKNNIAKITNNKIYGPIYKNENLHIIKLISKYSEITEELAEFKSKHIIMKKKPITEKYKKKMIKLLEKKKIINDNNVYYIYENINNLNKTNTEKYDFLNVVSDITYPYKNKLGIKIQKKIEKKFSAKNSKQLLLYNNIEKLIIDNKKNEIRENLIKIMKKDIKINNICIKQGN